MDKHPIHERVEIFLVASCYKNTNQLLTSTLTSSSARMKFTSQPPPRDSSTNNTKARGCKSSLTVVAQSGPCLGVFVRPVLVSPYPPVPLVFRWLPSAAGCRIVTKRWSVIKHCTSPFPTINPMLKFEISSCAYLKRRKIQKTIILIQMLRFLLSNDSRLQ